MAIQSPLPQGGVDVIVVTTVFLALAILAVIGRFYSRYLQRKPISIDDYLIVVALVSRLQGLYFMRLIDADVRYSLVRFSPLPPSAWAMLVSSFICLQALSSQCLVHLINNGLT